MTRNTVSWEYKTLCPKNIKSWERCPGNITQCEHNILGFRRILELPGPGNPGFWEYILNYSCIDLSGSCDARNQHFSK